MEDDLEFDPLYFDVPAELINRDRSVPRTFFLSSEAFKTYTGLQSSGFPIDERLYETINKLILSYKDRVKTSA